VRSSYETHHSNIQPIETLLSCKTWLSQAGSEGPCGRAKAQSSSATSPLGETTIDSFVLIQVLGIIILFIRLPDFSPFLKICLLSHLVLFFQKGKHIQIAQENQLHFCQDSRWVHGNLVLFNSKDILKKTLTTIIHNPDLSLTSLPLSVRVSPHCFPLPEILHENTYISFFPRVRSIASTALERETGYTSYRTVRTDF